MDSLDQKLLALLRIDARTSVADLAKKLNVGNSEIVISANLRWNRPLKSKENAAPQASDYSRRTAGRGNCGIPRRLPQPAAVQS
jgi:hypothetical protein